MKEGERVLIHFDREYKGNDPSVCIGEYENYKYVNFAHRIEWTCWEAHEDEIVNVTHWLPLPNPPQP